MPTGLTKDAGWQLGVRRTVPVPSDVVWDYLTREGLVVWLGETVLGATGEWYETADGTRGQLRSRSEGVRLRLTWQPTGWAHDSTLQLTLQRAVSGTTIAIHQERLRSAQDRASLLIHWRAVLGRIVEQLAVR
ncbi:MULTISPECIES: hypothetical protein [Actinoalloteichus]|uniref:Activator of Hsp90 ATPase 1 family protein n=1 Tax=Actinoalloteichus fjordicus TaxID=1612552 RepID=A0AAC9PQ62_9PSEU|nr:MULTISPECIES: hypothetical protein [Actinoalloteichus]APU12754.1 hypothetical protein UA74_03365 [Actinoalloteichus fjordicus]APU18725.1 hypothetical protein UA75_03460 [Actinoalloteichus sp. GBA129-24]